MGRIRNRKELRAAYDAAERRPGDDDKELTDEDEEDEDEDESEASEEEGGDEAEAEAEPKKRKAPAKSRARAVKVTRMRVVWGVFDNAHKCIATYEYPRRGDAAEHAARLTADKKNTHYVQPVKEPIEEKK
jgi:cobalamin biosynthesis protein CobT